MRRQQWGNYCVGHRGRLARRISRLHGEAGPPTSGQSPRVKRGPRLLGPAALCTCPLASPRSQVRARLGPGGYCRHPGNGGPQTCLPAAHGVAPPAALYSPSSPTNTQDPREGPSLVRRTTQDLLGGSLTRMAREGRRARQGTPREVSVMQAMTIKAKRAPGGCQRIVSLFPLWC